MLKGEVSEGKFAVNANEANSSDGPGGAEERKGNQSENCADQAEDAKEDNSYQMDGEQASRVWALNIETNNRVRSALCESVIHFEVRFIVSTTVGGGRRRKKDQERIN